MNFTPFHFTPIDTSFFSGNKTQKQKSGLDWPGLMGKTALSAVIAFIFFSFTITGYRAFFLNKKTDLSLNSGKKQSIILAKQDKTKDNNGNYLGINENSEEKDYLQIYEKTLINILKPEDLGADWSILDKKIVKSGPFITAFVKKNGVTITGEIRIIISKLTQYNVSELGKNSDHKTYSLSRVNNFGNYSDYLLSPLKDKSILRSVFGNVLVELEVNSLDKSEIQPQENYNYLDIIMKRLPSDIVLDKPKLALPGV